MPDSAGAMENVGCVTITESLMFRSKVTEAMYEMRAMVILHEMAHMWFGDLVTMRWWDDLWLNESFATWAGTLAQAEATRWRAAWTTFAQLHKAWACQQDQLPSTHPIAADIPDIEAVEFRGNVDTRLRKLAEERETLRRDYEQKLRDFEKRRQG